MTSLNRQTSGLSDENIFGSYINKNGFLNKYGLGILNAHYDLNNCFGKFIQWCRHCLGDHP